MRRFNRKPSPDGTTPDKRKIKAVKKTQDGITFDSTLELYMYNLLRENGIKFEMKISYIIQEEFTYRHEKIRQMVCTPDFVLIDYPVIIDVKGFANELAPVRYKMLKYKLHKEGKEVNICMPSNQAKCRKLITDILEGFTVDEPLTEHAGTIRKNKLKKAGWIYAGGIWCSSKGNSFGASYIMNLPHYEFNELLLNQ